MALMLGALYRALIAGRVDEETARQAAEEVAAYDSRLVTIEADVKLLKWMVATNVVLTGGVLVRLFVA